MSKKFKEFIIKYLDSNIEAKNINNPNSLINVYKEGYKKYYLKNDKYKDEVLNRKYGINVKVEMSEIIYLSRLREVRNSSEEMSNIVTVLAHLEDVKTVIRLIRMTSKEHYIKNATSFIRSAIELGYYLEGNVCQMLNKYYPKEFQKFFESIMMDYRLDTAIRRNYIKS